MRVARPRILHLITSSEVGGAERSLQRLALGLRHRFEPEVVCVKEIGAVGEQLRAESVPVVSLGGGTLATAPLAALRLARIVRRSRPDLVHAWLFQANLLARFATLGSGVPNLSSLRVALRGTPSWQVRLDVATRGLVDGYLAVSADVGRQAVAAGIPAERLRVIPNGLPEEAFLEAGDPAELRRSLGIPGEAMCLLCVGRLAPQKGQVHLLEALERLSRKAEPEAPWLILAGEGPQERELRRRAERALPRGRVVFAGVIDDPRPLYRAADLVVLPSLWEGMPNALLEAGAQGRACVASGVEGAGEVIEDGVTGRLVRPGSPEALAAALQELLCDAARRETMGRAARSRIRERFAFSRTADATAQLYEELIGSRAGASDPQSQ